MSLRDLVSEQADVDEEEEENDYSDDEAGERVNGKARPAADLDDSSEEDDDDDDEEAARAV